MAVMAVMAGCSLVPVVSAGRAALVVCWVAAAAMVGPAESFREVAVMAVMAERPPPQAVAVVTAAAADPPECSQQSVTVVRAVMVVPGRPG
jgi:hypothetical protein